MNAPSTRPAGRLAHILTLALCLVAGACGASDQPAAADLQKEGEAAAAKAPAASGDERVLAVIGDTRVTEAEVTELVAADILAAERQRHEALERGLEETVARRLLELEAAERGISTEELLDKEVTSKVEAPTDAAVDAFYEARKAQIRQPKEQVIGQIREYLTQQTQGQARQQLIDDLKGRHGYTSLLEPFRVPVKTEGFPARGAAGAPVTIVEFSDFECPYCSRVVPTLEQVEEKYGNKVRIVFRQFPLTRIHPNAQKAAEASLCAHEEGKFWEMHDAMFDEQSKLAVSDLKDKAARLGLDAAAFAECLDSGRHSEAVGEDLKAGASLGVSGTPALFINGRFLAGAQPFEEIAKVIDEELAGQGGS